MAVIVMIGDRRMPSHTRSPATVRAAGPLTANSALRRRPPLAPVRPPVNRPPHLARGLYPARRRDYLLPLNCTFVPTPKPVPKSSQTASQALLRRRRGIVVALSGAGGCGAGRQFVAVDAGHGQNVSQGAHGRSTRGARASGLGDCSRLLASRLVIPVEIRQDPPRVRREHPGKCSSLTAFPSAGARQLRRH